MEKGSGGSVAASSGRNLPFDSSSSVGAPVEVTQTVEKGEEVSFEPQTNVGDKVQM